MLTILNVKRHYYPFHQLDNVIRGQERAEVCCCKFRVNFFRFFYLTTCQSALMNRFDKGNTGLFGILHK